MTHITFEGNNSVSYSSLIAHKVSSYVSRLPDQEMLSVFHQNLRSPRPAVIVGTHRKPICPGAHDSKIFTLLDPFEFSLLARKSPDSHIGPTTSQRTVPLFSVITGWI